MLSFKTILPTLLLSLPAVLAQDHQQTAFQMECDTMEADNLPSVALDDWVNSLLIALHDNAKFAFEEVVVGFAGTEDGYDVLASIWENTAKGGWGNEWSLLVPTDDAFNKAGLIAPYSKLDAPTLYSLFTYHTLPASWPGNSTAKGHFTQETLFPLRNSAGSVFVGEMDGGDKVKVLSPSQAVIKVDDLDRGNQADNLNGFKLYEIDSIINPPSTLTNVLDEITAASQDPAAKDGLNLYYAGLNNTKTLNTLTGFGSGGSKGLTIFAPVNSAFDRTMTSDDMADWTKVLAGQYSSTQTVYSPQFENPETKVFMSNGNSVTFTTNSTGTFALSSDGGSSKVLQSDVLLTGGGVLHIVDTLLSGDALRDLPEDTAETNAEDKGGITLNLGAANKIEARFGGIAGVAVALIGALALM